MKTNLIFSFIFLAQLLSAQTFTEMTGTLFDGVRESSIAFSDVDGDSDQDLLITGVLSPNLFDPVSKLYTNDGAGNFTEIIDTPFDSVWASSVAFSDVDGDNDQDVLVIGRNSPNILISKLYTNDGAGNFIGVIDTPFEDIAFGSIAFSDIDGDNDQDVLITGQDVSFNQMSKLYTNDGAGNFIEVMDTPFDDVSSSSIAFSDVDGDNDQDVFITGMNSSFNRISKLYTNDGEGNFVEVMGTSFEGVSGSSIAFSDVDGDGDQDLFITGQNNLNVRISKLYTNDGAGNFTEVMGTPFDGIREGSIAFSDVDKDNDQDLLITGLNVSFNRISKLYINDGFGNFTEMMNTPFDGVVGSSIAFSDVDGDNDQDLLITGLNSPNVPISKLYINNTIVSSIENPTDELSFEFILYPNPTKTNTINVSYDSKESAWVDVSIFDLEGRLLKQHQEHIEVGKQTFSINISSLNKGIYTIQLDDGVNTNTQKFVVE